MIRLVLDSLRYWLAHMHVDGFRFDLASVLGRTGSSGHLLVPWVASYYPAKYAIDPQDLPPDLRIPEVEQRLSVRRGSGAALRFVVQPITAAVITAVDATGAVTRSASASRAAAIGSRSRPSGSRRSRRLPGFTRTCCSTRTPSIARGAG